MHNSCMANGQIYPPLPGKPGFLRKLADDSKARYENYIKKNQIDPNMLSVLSGLSAIAEHLALQEEAQQKSKTVEPPEPAK